MKEKKNFQVGIDVGSATVKLVVTDDKGNLLFGDYRRHHAHTQQTLADLLKDAKAKTGAEYVKAHLTGSGSIGLSKALGIPFTQEVVAVADKLRRYYPQTDVAIELGGEDAKIIYFNDGLDERIQ